MCIKSWEDIQRQFGTGCDHGHQELGMATDLLGCDYYVAILFSMMAILKVLATLYNLYML